MQQLLKTCQSWLRRLAKARRRGDLEYTNPTMQWHLKRIKAKQPEAEIIILSGQGSIKTSIEAMKLGAEDFIEKPVNISELLDKISDAKDKRFSILEQKSVKDIEKILKSKGW